MSSRDELSTSRSSLSRRAVLLGAASAGAGVGVGVTNRPRAAAGAERSPASFDDEAVSTLEEALGRVPSGATLRVTRRWQRSTPLAIERPVTLRFEGSGAIELEAHTTAIDIRSSGVAVVDAVLRGAGATTKAMGRGIRAVGTAAAPLTDIRVVRCTVSNQSYSGIALEHVRGFAVADCSIDSVGYGAVMILSCMDGVITGNAITDVVQPAGFVNSYGVIVSRDDSRDLSDAPRSARITVDHNEVTRVLNWEGIDTHSGEEIVIRENTLRDCRVGVAVVPSRDSASGEYAVASREVVVAGNDIRRTQALAAGSGIVVRGAGTAIGDTAERTSATVSGNTVVGYGGSPREAAILAYFTQQLIISSNTLSECVRAGVCLYHSNEAATVTRTTVSFAAGGAGTVAVELPGPLSTARVMATRVLPATNRVPAAFGAVCVSESKLTLLANEWSSVSKVLGGSGASSGSIDRFADGP